MVKISTAKRVDPEKIKEALRVNRYLDKFQISFAKLEKASWLRDGYIDGDNNFISQPVCLRDIDLTMLLQIYANGFFIKILPNGGDLLKIIISPRKGAFSRKEKIPTLSWE